MLTLYLADTLKTKRPTIREKHNYSKVPTTAEDLLPEILKHHAYSLPKEDSLLKDQQYAGDTGWVAVNAKHIAKKIKKEAPEQQRR